MSDIIKVEHAGCEITYDEFNNDWQATPSGFNDSIGRYPSLRATRDAIDRWNKKEHPFQRYQAILCEWGTPKCVTVTSQEGDECWHVNADGRRGKSKLSQMRPLEPNKDRISAMNSKQAKINSLLNEIRTIVKEIEATTFVENESKS